MTQPSTPTLTPVVGVPATITNLTLLRGQATFDGPYLGGPVGAGIGSIPFEWDTTSGGWKNSNTDGPLELPLARTDVPAAIKPQGWLYIDLTWVDEAGRRQSEQLRFRPAAGDDGQLDLTRDQDPEAYTTTASLQALTADAEQAAAAANTAAGRVNDAILDLEAERQAVADIIADTAQSAAQAAAAAGLTAWEGGDHTTIPAQAGYYRLMTSSEIGQVWQRPTGGGTSVRRPELEAPLTPTVYAERYGFKATNTAVDNDAALTAAYAATPTGGTLEVRPGSYAMSAELTLDRAVTLRGYGATLTAATAEQHRRFKLTAGATVEGFTLDGAAGAGVRGYNGGTITLTGTPSGARVINNTIRNATGIAVYGYGGATDVTIQGNVMDGAYHAVFVEPDPSGNVPRGWAIINNTARNLTGVAVCGIKVKGATASGGRHRIIGNRMTGNSVVGTPDNELGIELQGGGAAQAGNDHTTISANVVEGWHFGISVDSSRAVTVSGNSCRANLYANIELAAAMYASVSGNACDGRNSNGTVVTRVGIVSSNLYAGARTEGHAITGNTIMGATQHGIKIQDTNGVGITGNTVRPLVAATGIEVLRSDYPAITGNVLTGAGNTSPAVVLNATQNISAATVSGNVFGGTWQKPLDVYTSAAGQTAENISIIGNALKATFSTGMTLTGAGTFTKFALNGNVGQASMEGNWLDWTLRLGVLEGIYPPNNNVTAGEGSVYLDNYTAGSGRMWVKRSGGVSNTGWKEIPRQAAAQANSTATDVAGLLADFNALLVKLRTDGVLAP